MVIFNSTSLFSLFGLVLAEIHYLGLCLEINIVCFRESEPNRIASPNIFKNSSLFTFFSSNSDFSISVTYAKWLSITINKFCVTDFCTPIKKNILVQHSICAYSNNRHYFSFPNAHVFQLLTCFLSLFYLRRVILKRVTSPFRF